MTTQLPPKLKEKMFQAYPKDSPGSLSGFCRQLQESGAESLWLELAPIILRAKEMAKYYDSSDDHVDNMASSFLEELEKVLGV